MIGRGDSKHAMQVGGIVITAVAILNVAFYFLSVMYFDDRAARFGALSEAQISGVRGAFAMFTGSIGIASIISTLAPREIGHGIAGLAGLGSLYAAYGAFSHEMPGVLTAALVVLGVAFPLLVWRSLARSRAAWAALTSLCSVYATVLLFGAPKVRGILGVGLWTALIIPGLLAVATVAMTMIRDDYRDAT